MTHSQAMQIASIGGVQLAYSDVGEGPVLVLIHGFCGSSAYWNQIAPSFNAYRVITPDLRGHGQSSAGNETSTMELMADDIAGLLAHLHIDQAIVFGHSLGGYVTLALAERHPQLVKKFALVHSTALPDSDEAKDKRLQGVKTIDHDGIVPFVAGLIPKLFSEANRDTMSEQVQAIVNIGNATSPIGAMNSLEGMRVRPDRNHVLRDRHVPVLLVAGSEDQIIPAERVFSETGPHIQTRTIEKAGHMSMIEAPDRLVSVMTVFIQS